MSVKQIFSTREAAQYLGVEVTTVNYHRRQSGRLKGQMMGNSMVFTREELDEFNATRRPAGRPKKEANS